MYFIVFQLHPESLVQHLHQPGCDDVAEQLNHLQLVLNQDGIR